MDRPISELSAQFSKLPGIGPRQARRIVEALMRKSNREIEIFAEKIAALPRNTMQCPRCLRFSERRTGTPLCDICRDESRSIYQIMVVEKDIDLEAMEKSGIYNGGYFVLGRAISLASDTPSESIPLHRLHARIKEDREKAQSSFVDSFEIILALSATTEGDETAEVLKREVEREYGETIHISVLGRGLSTGSELEYADKETLRSAFESRHT